MGEDRIKEEGLRVKEKTREMKDSGVEWIGEIPEDWDIRKLGNISNLRIGNSIKDSEKEDYADPKEAIPYIATKDISFNNKINYENGMYIKTSDREFNRAYKNSILICIEGGSAGRKIAKTEKEVSFGNKLCNINSSAVLNEYIYYYSLSPSFSDSFKSRITGLIPGVTLSEMGQIEIVIPNKDHQRAIANFLDSKVSLIDDIIEKTKQSIGDYKKYKQSLITETVTKGLNPDVEMKDSGIEWIGEIPKHWDVVNLNRLYSQVKKKNEGLVEENLLSLSYGEIVKRDINSNEGLLPASFEGYNIINNGNIVLRLTDLQNDHTSLRVGFCTQTGIITSAYISLKGEGKRIDKYMYYYLHSFDIYKGFYGMGAGVRQSLTFDGIKNLKLLYPPITEQQQIVDYLDNKCLQIDRIIGQKEKLIKELETYKKSLIYEYVTGKTTVEM